MIPKVSIIVPIYNTETFLEKCLLSILQQTMKEIEIICIDDCSPDHSYLIVKKYIEKDSRISLIKHEKNKGLGGARNTGIDAARADFLIGVDSDDFIKSNMVETLWEASDFGQVDVTCCGFDRVNELGEIEKVSTCGGKKLVKINQSADVLSLTNPAFWNKLWRKSLFHENDLWFPEDLYYEDLATTPRLIAKSKTVKIIENSLYCYQVRSGSITTTFGQKHIKDYFDVFDILLEFIRDNDLYDNLRDSLIETIHHNLYTHSKSVVNSTMLENEKVDYLHILFNKKISYLERRNLNTIEAGHNSFLHEKVEKVSKDNITYLLSPKSHLSFSQQIGSSFFGLVFRTFINKNQYRKLNEDPKSFFKDSKSGFARSVGHLLRII